MFQVGDIVQVIIVPKKYKQYDITGAAGIVKTVYSNNIRIHISSYYNEKSEEGDFYFKEMEILCSYRVVEYPFGRMTVGGNACGK